MGRACNLIQLNLFIYLFFFFFFLTTTGILIYFRDDPTNLNVGIFVFKNT